MIEGSYDNIEVTLKISLDDTDRVILRIFNSHPNHYFRLREIKTILLYERIEISNSKLAKKLEFFSITALINREKRGRFYSYIIC
jgi:predicted DNA-binding ArsR family transcriptional regulator